MKKHLLFLSALIMFTCSAHAQLNLNKLGKKVREKVENKKEQVETEAEKEVQQVAEPSHAKHERDQGGEYNRNSGSYFTNRRYTKWG